MTEGLSREVEIDPRHAALLLIDVQNYTANRDGGVYRGLVPREIDKRYGLLVLWIAAIILAIDGGLKLSAGTPRLQ